MTAQKHYQTRGRMLAFVLLLALLLATGIPQGQDTFAGTGGNNDTITSSPGIDSTEVASLENEETIVAVVSFGDWLLMMASMLL